MSYLLESWKLDCACHSERSAIFVGHLANTPSPFWNSGILVIGGGNTLKWPALFSMKYTKYLFPLVKELSIFEYK
jgi:hypothetical protein